jgi:hypothetical protein
MKRLIELKRAGAESIEGVESRDGKDCSVAGDLNHLAGQFPLAN